MLGVLADSHWVQMLGLSVVVQVVSWVIAAALHTEKFYDLVGSLTFLLVSSLSHKASIQSARHNVASYLVMAWACRLGTFLAIRVIRDGGDRRFDKVKHDPAVFLKYWVIQGLWVFITLVPTITLNMSKRNPALGMRDYLGWTIWGLGFLIEVVADMQKSVFRSDPANEGQFISSGLWSVSRHPNYFGEILLWFGLYVACSAVFRGWEYLTVASPIFVMLLITRLSGVPLLEASGLKRWGGSAEYQRYIRDVPVLIPFIKT